MPFLDDPDAVTHLADLSYAQPAVLSQNQNSGVLFRRMFLSRHCGMSLAAHWCERHVQQLLVQETPIMSNARFLAARVV